MAKSLDSSFLFAANHRVAFEKMFLAVDTSGDGNISVEEWKVFQRSLGMTDDAAAEQAFNTIDVNGDGDMSLEEFLDGSFDFMYNEEKSPNSEFLGALLDV